MRLIQTPIMLCQTESSAARDDHRHVVSPPPYRFAIALLLVGCGESSQEPTATTEAATTASDSNDESNGETDGFQNRPCDPSTRAGRFIVQLEQDYTQVEGQVFDLPNPVPKTEVDAADGCQLLVSENYFCDPACGTSGVCTAQQTCTPKPQAVPVGEVIIKGLSTDVTMQPNVTGFYLNLGELPHPGFEPGATIQLDAAGDQDPPFTLVGIGSEPLVMSHDEIPMGRDRPVSLSWTPPATAAVTRVEINVDIGHHGGSPATIACDVDDTGAFEIPASLVNQLFDFGVAGFPEIEMTRHTIDSASVADRCVELTVAPSSSSLAVQIDGINSCSTSDDCPDGQVCQSDLSCG